MPAVIKLSGKQYLVNVGDKITTDRLKMSAEKMLVPDLLSGQTVTLEKVSDQKAKKVRIIKFKPKTGYRRTRGHRQLQTVLLVQSITSSVKPAKKNAKNS